MPTRLAARQARVFGVMLFLAAPGDVSLPVPARIVRQRCSSAFEDPPVETGMTLWIRGILALEPYISIIHV